MISGDPTDIDIRIADAGPADSTDTTFSLVVPNGETIAAPPAGCPAVNGSNLTCSVGTIAAGQSLDVHVILTPLAGTQTLTDTLAVSSDQVQLSPAASTLSAPVSVNPSQPTSVTDPVGVAAPTFGEYVRLTRDSGAITAQLPNGQQINIADYAVVPVGTIVTATSGTVDVAAVLKDGSTTHASFRYGRFQVTQPQTGTGAIDVKLDGSLSGCSPGQLSTRATAHARDAFRAAPGLLVTGRPLTKPRPRPRKNTTRKLWGHDNGGTYTITGNRGAATVQGTTWEVVDTCTTTTIIVYRDKVSVVAIGNTVPKRAIVSAGHRIVLRAARER